MEQKVLSLCGDRLQENDGKPMILSPSSILLKGYTPSMVDQEIRRSSIKADIADLRRRMSEIDLVEKDKHLSEPSDFDESFSTRSEIPSESESSDIALNTGINKIDLDDFPPDVVSIMKEVLNGIDSNQKGDDVPK